MRGARYTVDTDVSVFTPKLQDHYYNRLLYNCIRELLPPKEKMELFLTKCKEAFDNPERFLGGMFDWVLEESELNNHLNL